MSNLAELPPRVRVKRTLARWRQKFGGVDSPILRYGFAVVCVAIGLWLALTSEYYHYRDIALPVLTLSIALTTWYAGTGPALLAIALSTACFSYFFTEPLYVFEIAPVDIPYFLLFLAWAGVVTTFSVVRRRIEGNLRQARDRLQVEVEQRTQQARLLDQTHDAIFVRQIDGVIAYWNRGAEEQYGWPSDQAVGKVIHELLQTRFPEPLTAIQHRLLLADRWEGELVHTKRDGSLIIVSSRWALQRDEQQRPNAIMETSNDITKRKRGEDEVRELSRQLAKRAVQLETSNKELESFAYSVSHDLRAPLRHITGYAELLQKQASSLLDDKARRYMQTILEASKKMGNLIDDLLAFSRIGRAETKMATVDMRQLVKEVLAEIGQETRGRDIVWKVGELPICFGDRSMLRLVLVNLVSNAVKFTRSRKPAEIEIGCVDGNMNEVEMFVRDNGAGFDMRYANKLFGVFQRLHLPEQFEGTGIGLATVQRIIHGHGGKVRANGAVNHGATFYFSLLKQPATGEKGSTP